MAAMLIYGKTLKTPFLQNYESFEAEFRYVALGTQDLQICSNNDPRLTFDLFYWQVRIASLCICMGKILKYDFHKMF